MSYRRHAEVKPANAPWIEEIPEHWDERPFYAVAKERWAKNIGMKEDNLLSLSYGNIIRKDINTPNGLLPESFETYQIVEPDDVVFRLTDLQNDKRSLRSAICLERGIITSAYLAVRSEGVLPGFMSYLMRAYDVQKVFYSMGGGLRQSLGFEDLRRMSVVAPDPDEQVAIARFLDRETGLIDGLIEKKTRFIALLKEKRAAVITHAVTKGIDPDAPMKDSGVDWLGRVPAHWEVLRIAALFREVSRPADPALPVLSVSIHDGVTDGELADEDRDRKVALSEDRTKYQGVAPGDLVYNMMRAWQGAFGAVTVKGLVSPAYVVAAPVTTFRTKFVEHLLHTKSAAEEIRRFSRGIADFRLRLYWDHFRALKACLPPLEEQDRILSAIDVETSKIDGLTALTERSIDLLREKRTALIAAAVTGKIDVRAAA
ncbi:restriction endonuclease subunit S [Tabrizicola sp. BL-A-41-H6]|uniref:restriction endonuclease subunit S n=1 Tax=Tabrizicola sp. BL-A-41-H6 TaxID=3421107 RepID=UPI003D664055